METQKEVKQKNPFFLGWAEAPFDEQSLRDEMREPTATPPLTRWVSRRADGAYVVHVAHRHKAGTGDGRRHVEKKRNWTNPEEEGKMRRLAHLLSCTRRQCGYVFVHMYTHPGVCI